MDLPITTLVSHKLTSSGYDTVKSLRANWTLVQIFDSYSGDAHLYMRHLNGFFLWFTCQKNCKNTIYFRWISEEGIHLQYIILFSLVLFTPFKVFIQCADQKTWPRIETHGHRLLCNFPRLLSPFLCRPYMLRQ